MAKSKNPRRVGDNEARAKLRMIRISPQKLNLVAQLIRGKKVETALADLEFSHKRISGEVKKVLESAIANAENNHGLDIDSLIVSEAYVGKNLVMKRFRARARGRGARILKPFSELTIVVNRTWESRWYANTAEYGDLLHQDLAIRAFLMSELKAASVYTARPGVVIGKKGADIEVLRKRVASMVDGEVFINLVEVRKPEVDANLVADGIAQQLERRVSFRRAMKRSLQSAMRMGAKGCKIKLGGRLGGAEIARVEQYQEGSVPLHTMRADIDYGVAREIKRGF